MTVPHDAPTDWLRAHAHPLAGCEPTDDFADLEPLKERLGGARLVALGEGTHGTREFFLLKHRLIRFLVKELDFRLVAFEASWPEAEQLNEYVATGAGDPAQLLAGLHFWTWYTEEVLDLLRWLREFNTEEAGGTVVRFSGFDVQHPRRTLEGLLGYLEQVDPVYHAYMARAVAPLLRHLPNPAASPHDPTAAKGQMRAMVGYQHEPAGARSACRAALSLAERRLQQRQNTYAAQSSTIAFATALLSARAAKMGEMLYADAPTFTGPRILTMAKLLTRHLIRTRLGRVDDHRHRDAMMAAMVAHLMDDLGPAGKAVLWAHNGHVSTRSRTMGAYLREQFGSELLTVGFAFGAGSFNARRARSVFDQPGPPQVHHIAEPPPNSYEAGLRSMGLPQAILDLAAPRAGESVDAWLDGPRPMRMIGALYEPTAPERFLYPARLSREYDVIAYVDFATATRLLP